MSATGATEPDDEFADEAPAVRPYAVTGGRTRPKGDALQIETLVTTKAVPQTRLTVEKTRILQLSQGQYLSIAELSAHVHLPVGVVRVIVGDLVEEGLVSVHGVTATESTYHPATTLSVLESVLNGISAL